MSTLCKSGFPTRIVPFFHQLGRELLIVLFAGLVCSGASLASATPDERDGQLLDELIGKYVSADGAPGAAAALVRRDGSVTLRAYGVADLATKRPVDPNNTVFRIGSISKTFTAIAILQMVDEGKLELEADANRYLKGVQIPAGASPVRVLDLLTHRAGFDGELTDVGLDDRLAAAESPNQRLQGDIIRIRPAGMITSYDNMAWGLLGQIVESIDGIPYAQAITKRIFLPLGMSRSAVGLPSDLANVATPYEVGSDGKPRAKPQIYLRHGWQGAGDISTTAADMTRLLQALLAQGAYPGGRLLKAETFKLQTDTSRFSFHSGVHGTGLGVYGLGNIKGGGFGHGGTIRGFNASLVFLPKHDLAFFAVMNLNSPAPEMSLRGLSDYLAHPPGVSLIDPTDYMTIELPYRLEGLVEPNSQSSIASTLPPEDGSKWNGRYSGLRMESYEALLPRLAVALLLQPKTVRTQPDGTLFINATGPYRQTGPGLYSLDKPAGPLLSTVGFSQIGSDIVMGPHALQLSRRLSWYERPIFTVGGLLFAPIILFIAALLGRRNADQRERQIERTQVWSSLFFLVGIGLELSIASSWHRIDSFRWIVSTWRIALGVALLVILTSALLLLKRAYISLTQVEKSNLHPGSFYASAMFLLVLWIWFAAIYWQVPSRIF